MGNLLRPLSSNSALPVLLVLALGQICAAQKVAITFDDLPLNGELPPGVTRVEVTRNTLAVLKKRHVPAVYGFVNAKKLEGNADAAEALKLWASAEPVGSHTYAHMDLNANPAEAVEQRVCAVYSEERCGVDCMVAVELFEYRVAIFGFGAGDGDVGVRARHQPCAAAAPGGIQQHDFAGCAGSAA